MVEGDAKVTGAPSSSAPREVNPGPARMTQQPAAKVRKQNRSGRVHQIENEKYVMNRTGHRLCEAYQTGSCARSTNGIWCSQAWDHTHQCNKCLGNHPENRCPHKEIQVPGFAKKGEGKSKGSGRKGGGGKKAAY